MVSPAPLDDGGEQIGDEVAVATVDVATDDVTLARLLDQSPSRHRVAVLVRHLEFTDIVVYPK